MDGAGRTGGVWRPLSVDVMAVGSQGRTDIQRLRREVSREMENRQESGIMDMERVGQILCHEDAGVSVMKTLVHH